MLLGILAGVLTTLLLAVAAAIWAKIVRPWYEELRYAGVDLRGKWLAQHTTSHGISYHYTLLLKQHGHELHGTMTITKMNSPPGVPGGPVGDYSQGFTVKGDTWEGFVMLTMRSDDRRSLSFATTLLQVQNRGQLLSGRMAYRRTQPDGVGSEDVLWTRA